MQGYSEYELGDLLEYEQPTAYIVESTDYSDSYSVPVLTAGKSFILGYTNEMDGVFDKTPVIIFDDFTTATQYVNFPFKVKSSAMKILHINKDLVLPKYIYYRIQIIQFDHSTHKRYWIQQYSKIRVSIPPIPEQERIVARIEELFSQLDAGVETLKKTKAQLAVYRQAVLKEAFEKVSARVLLGSISESRLGKMLDSEKNIGVPRRYLRNINVRWHSFDLSDLSEMPIEENERGTYIYNSKDLCMIEHIPDIAKAGIYSLKIEGRMKTPFYVGTVVKAYRQAIDDYFADPKLYEKRLPYYLAEVSKASHRDYTTAFYYGKPDGNQQVYTNNSYIREYDFIGMVQEDWNEETGFAWVEQRNKFSVGEEIEVMPAQGDSYAMKVTEIRNQNGEAVASAPHPQELLQVKFEKPVKKFDMLRKRPSDVK